MTSAPSTVESAVFQRYRDPELHELARSNETVATQLGHRSVRRFLPDPVDEDTLQALIAAAQSASTSSNLQSWSVVAVQGEARKARLASLAGEQGFVASAPLFLVWLADLGRARRLAARHEAPLAATEYLESTVLGVVDAALAAQNAVVAAESLGLGAVFVGAVRNRPEDVAAELGLPDHVFPVFGLAIGRPDPSEESGIKPRLPQVGVLHRETYDSAASDRAITEYEPRLSAYFEEQGRSHSWTRTVLARLRGPESLSGRDRLRQALGNLGWPSR